MARTFERRSFLARVAGAGALLAVGTGAAGSVRPPRRGLCSDRDSGPGADPPRAWYGDRDSGAGSDPLGPAPDPLTDGDSGRSSDHRQIYFRGECPAGKRRLPGDGERG